MDFVVLIDSSVVPRVDEMSALRGAALPRGLGGAPSLSNIGAQIGYEL